LPKWHVVEQLLQPLLLYMRHVQLVGTCWDPGI
jgi:hypothetical protein